MELLLNRPLANTYGWLHANGTAVTSQVEGAAALTEELPAGVEAFWEEGGDAALERTGAGTDTAALLKGVAKRVYRVESPVAAETPLRLHFAFCEPDAGARVEFRLGEGAALNVVMDYAGGTHAAAVRTEAVLGKNAQLRLAQIQCLNDDAVFIHDVGAVCGGEAQLSLVRLVLSGSETYDGCSVALTGERSGFTADVGYRLGGDSKLDMNYEAIHTGKKTTSEMNIAGVLSDNAFKLFRGTIDLRRGCAGAVGNELEDVLMMDDTTRNQTIPVILCDEEDVVGNHGATIGRLDEEVIYYLESRGMERGAIYDMMARARIDAVIRRIPDEKTVAALLPDEED